MMSLKDVMLWEHHHTPALPSTECYVTRYYFITASTGIHSVSVCVEMYRKRKKIHADSFSTVTSISTKN